MALVLGLLLTALPATPAAAAAAATLQVQVSDQAGQPLAGARIELFSAGVGLLAAAHSGQDGQALLVVPTGARDLWLRVWGQGHGVVDQALPSLPGNPLTVTLPAAFGGLSGQVTDPDGLPLEEIRVTAWGATTGKAGEALTGAGGLFVLRGLPPGEYALHIAGEGFQPQALSATVTPGVTSRVNVSLLPARGTVAGTVVDARSGSPVNGARVELLRSGWGVVASTTTSGGGGRFILTAPPAAGSDYTLRVTAGGYDLLETAPFALADGGQVEFSGAGQLKLSPLYGAVWGFVLNPSGDAVADAAVQLQLQGAGTVATTSTNTEGFFSFDQVLPGTYRVRVYPGRYWTASDSPWLAVAAGEQYPLQVTPVSIQENSWFDGVVAGVVSAGGSAPLAGATVTLLRGQKVVDTTTTDQWGRYRFSHVPGNEGVSRTGATLTATGYIVRVEAEGYLPTDQPAGGPEGELTVRTQELTEANFALRTAQVHLSGRVLDEKGRPLEGARLTLYQVGRAEPLSEMAAGAGGNFRFPPQPLNGSGRYYVVAAGEDYYPAISPVLDATSSPTGYVETNLALKPVVAELQGTVTSLKGEGLAGVQVTVVRPADGRTWQTETGDGGWFTVAGLPAGPGDYYLVRATGSSGAATAAATAGAAGAPTAAATTGAATTGAAASHRAAIGTAQALLVPGGSRVVSSHLTLALPAAVAGVVYGWDGRPLARATVELRQEGIAASIARTTTDTTGRYRFDGLAPGGRYTVLASAEGYIASSLSPGATALPSLVSPAAGETAQLDILLLPRR